MPRGRPRKNPDAAPAPKKTTKVSKPRDASATLGFEQQMFLAADKLRKNLAPSARGTPVRSTISFWSHQTEFWCRLLATTLPNDGHESLSPCLKKRGYLCAIN